MHNAGMLTLSMVSLAVALCAVGLFALLFRYVEDDQ